MSKRPAKPTADAAPALSIPERVLLFCVASDTDWEHAGITSTTVTAMIDERRARRARGAAGEGRLTAMAGFKDLIEPMTNGAL
jgi:hypothetical protein